MKLTNKSLRHLVLSLLCCYTAISCKKEPVQPASCNDGTCCGQAKDTRYQFAESIEGEAIRLGGPPPGTYGIWGVVFNRQIPQNYTLKQQRFAVVCELSVLKVENLSFDASIFSPSDTTFRPNYRVWGRLYMGIDMPTITPGPPTFMYIDRIERFKN